MPMGGGKSTNTYTRLRPLTESLLHTNQVESKIREFKAAVSRFESRAQTMQYNNTPTKSPPPLQLQPLAINDNNEQSGHDNENEVHEFKALVQVLHHVMKKQEEAMLSLREKNTALEKQISELATITYDMKAKAKAKAVILALAQAGLESSNLIVGIDFTKSNEWTGARSFHHKSLHHLGASPNPYEQAISIIGKTLSAFDEDNLLPCYGFGDATTHDQEIFSSYPDDSPCNGFEEVLRRYKEIVPHIILAGPTSFAPIIEAAIRIVDNSGGQYHVLMIIADGQAVCLSHFSNFFPFQMKNIHRNSLSLFTLLVIFSGSLFNMLCKVTRSVDTGYNQLSPQEQNTINAIVKASDYPLSIVLVGVGDGPWDMMHKYDNNIPARAFDNFQFVNFTELMSKHILMSKKETDFALSALMEIPLQYKATIDLQLLGRRRGNPGRFPLPPPVLENSSLNSNPNYQQSSSNEQRMGFPYAPPTPTQHYAPPTPTQHSSQNRVDLQNVLCVSEGRKILHLDVDSRHAMIVDMI
ncbi:hypothetical protein Pint_09653 [Pistacia integerrima]|uniref:Uncharacterized protein n=1 Tax=Pistacia integerrima TaxID=434235 RepID=A0ACC0XLP0_9ROSI|nr:hypothetical protein Pint_09653 [Pistacia integerrima]